MSRPTSFASTPPPASSGTADVSVVSVDTGGTFTDLLLWTGDELRTLKVPSTPRDPAEAVLDGLARLVGEGRRFVLLHGSTVATNALLERKGAKVTLITNRGFEDVLEIGRQNRPQLYALVGSRPPPLVPPERRLGIGGRLDPRGVELEPLPVDDISEIAERTTATGAEAVAICLLHSYADADHEEAIAQALAPLGLPLSVSARLLPEYREYERTSTTVVNAYVSPVMDRYLGRLAIEAGAERVAIMGSNGGTVAVDRARREPVHTVLSGPAGGVVGALAWARRADIEGIVSFDMGGTSTDVSLCPGQPLRTREFEIGGHPVAVPVLDIHTVGAGGGSVASVDPGGALRVGPESAGADPGPVSYGKGGDRVTVTDAHVWLGRIPTDAFLGGESALDREAVRGPLADLAERLAATPDEAAEGILAVADAAMERALRVISVERGYDPANLALVAFGGAGALHAADLTQRIGAQRAMVPPDPGLLSAFGILTAPLAREASRTVLVAADAADAVGRLAETFDELERTVVEGLREEDVTEDAMRVERWVDARYRGQSFELRVAADDWIERFHRTHELRYGYRRDAAPVEAVTLRAVGTAPGPDVPLVPLPAASGPPETGGAEVLHGGQALVAQRIWRRDLRAGHVLEGPALVLDYSATTWVPPRWHLEVDAGAILHLLHD